MCLLFQHRIREDYFAVVNKLQKPYCSFYEIPILIGLHLGVSLWFLALCFNDTNPSPDSFLLMSGQRTRQICISVFKNRFGKGCNLVTILHQPLFYCFCSINKLCIRIFNLVSWLLQFSFFLGGCAGLWWIMVAIFLCENGGLMVLPTWANDWFQGSARVAR